MGVTVSHLLATMPVENLLLDLIAADGSKRHV